MNNAHRVVSSEAEELILVDADDNETGYLSKAECHDGKGVLHRAFSLFLFNDRGELLLQQRAESKRLWPGYWSNSCCSHPRRGESMEVATGRRLQDELNIEANLEFVYKFSYAADFGDAGSENELCHVYLGRVSGSVLANDHEISATRFISAAELEREIKDSPESFTPWFKMEWDELTGEHSRRLSHYGVSLSRDSAPSG
ncbi:MAG: isopentenyl-diphosphate Delta-isomerase [Woeseiaceae bacterium]|nr:isopentenyl-diphosphate Delta-isomerase [Woeseiaceae bacterium]